MPEELPREGSRQQWRDASRLTTRKASEWVRDWYGSYADLSRHEGEGVDFRIILESGSSGLAVVAPHGGGIEPGTTEIAAAVAAGHHTFYSFDGLKLSGNWKLHLTSVNFDEPVGLETVRRARSVIAIHGCRDNRSIVYFGGLDHELGQKICEALEQAGFPVGRHAGLMGNDLRNFCNRGTSGSGVQLEISSGLRRQMFADLSRRGRSTKTPLFERFAAAVRQASSAG